MGPSFLGNWGDNAPCCADTANRAFSGKLWELGPERGAFESLRVWDNRGDSSSQHRGDGELLSRIDKLAPNSFLVLSESRRLNYSTGQARKLIRVYGLQDPSFLTFFDL